MSSPATIQEAAEKIFATAYRTQDSELESLDPAGRIGFSRPSMQGVHRFDQREDAELNEVMFDYASPAMERERAVWEYGDRLRVNSLGALKNVARHDPEPSIRWTTLWAIQKFCGIQSIDSIRESLADEHPRCGIGHTSS